MLLKTGKINDLHTVLLRILAKLSLNLWFFIKYNCL